MIITSLAANNLVALIDETNCIGCTKCIKSCPVGAIIGSTRMMHTVVSALCTGCDHCIAVCPTECIHLQQVPSNNCQQKYVIATSHRFAINKQCNTGQSKIVMPTARQPAKDRSSYKAAAAAAIARAKAKKNSHFKTGKYGESE